MTGNKHTEFFPEEIFRKFDQFLQLKGLSYKDGVVVGGAAVAILYRKTRMTQDIDLLTVIPADVKEISVEFAQLHGLSDDWLNNRVVNLASCKPHGWGKDLVSIYNGVALSLASLSRQNLLRTKVFAFCDRSEGVTMDLPDIKSMIPSVEELDEACQWTMAELSQQRNTKTQVRFFDEAIALLKDAVRK